MCYRSKLTLICTGFWVLAPRTVRPHLRSSCAVHAFSWSFLSKAGLHGITATLHSLYLMHGLPTLVNKSINDAPFCKFRALSALWERLCCPNSAVFGWNLPGTIHAPLEHADRERRAFSEHAVGSMDRKTAVAFDRRTASSTRRISSSLKRHLVVRSVGIDPPTGVASDEYYSHCWVPVPSKSTLTNLIDGKLDGGRWAVIAPDTMIIVHFSMAPVARPGFITTRTCTTRTFPPPCKRSRLVHIHLAVLRPT